MTNYKICIEGRLEERWSDWFSGLAVTVEPGHGGPTISTLTGPVADQPALRGLLNRIWDLNLNLISVNQVQETHGKSFTAGIIDPSDQLENSHNI